MKIEIKDQYLAEYIMYKLDKNINLFTEEELSSIDEISLDCNELNDFKLEELRMFPNIERLILRNFVITTTDFYNFIVLKRLKDITFEKCNIEKPKLISGLYLNKLSLINCNIHDYRFICILDTLKELTIIRGNIDINKLNKLEKLEYLQLSYTTISDVNINVNLNALKELYIDNTNVINLKFISKLCNLKVLSIDENQYNNNLNLIEELKENNILILNEGLTEFESVGDSHE